MRLVIRPGIALQAVMMWLPLATTRCGRVRRIGVVVASLALAVWLRGLRCGSVLVVVVGVKGAFGVAFGDRTSSTLDTHHGDQGRTQLRGCRAEV